MASFNGISLILAAVPVTSAFTDACNIGTGGFYEGDWFYCVIIWSDNMTPVASINRCTSRNPYTMECLRYMFWLSAAHNFCLTANHIPGVENMVADKISRLHVSSHRYS